MDNNNKIRVLKKGKVELIEPIENEAIKFLGAIANYIDKDKTKDYKVTLVLSKLTKDQKTVQVMSMHNDMANVNLDLDFGKNYILSPGKK